VARSDTPEISVRIQPPIVVVILPLLFCEYRHAYATTLLRLVNDQK